MVEVVIFLFGVFILKLCKVFGWGLNDIDLIKLLYVYGVDLFIVVEL